MISLFTCSGCNAGREASETETRSEFRYVAVATQGAQRQRPGFSILKEFRRLEMSTAETCSMFGYKKANH